MYTKIKDDLGIDVTVRPRLTRTKDEYIICMRFNVMYDGVTWGEYYISLGLKCRVSEWKRGKGEVKGKDSTSLMTNCKILEYRNNANMLLMKIIAANPESPEDILTELKANARAEIIGKAPKGKLKIILSRLGKNTFNMVMTSLFADRDISGDRIRNYELAERNLSEYYKGHIPTIDRITTAHLQKIKMFIQKKYPNPNTHNTLLSQIASVFNYATRMKILKENPVPPKFRGSFKPTKRPILTKEDIEKLMKLEDDVLVKNLRMVKMCLMVQLTTGIGYGDLRTLEPENLMYDDRHDQYYLKKERNKTGIPFIVNLTSAAEYYVRELMKYNKNDKLLFDLPSIEYIVRMYKKLGKLAGIDKSIGTYTLRHTYAVDFMNSDGKLEDLQIRLGHTEIKTTQIYGRISAERNARTTSRLEANSFIHRLPV